MELKELKDKILEALYSALPITVLVYLMSLTPWFEFSTAELITFSVGAVLLVVGIGLFNMGADLAMTPMGTHVGSGLSKQRRLGLLLFVCFVLGMLITIAEPDLQVLANQVSAVMNGTVPCPSARLWALQDLLSRRKKKTERTCAAEPGSAAQFFKKLPRRGKRPPVGAGQLPCDDTVAVIRSFSCSLDRYRSSIEPSQSNTYLAPTAIHTERTWNSSDRRSVLWPIQ